MKMAPPLSMIPPTHTLPQIGFNQEDEKTRLKHLTVLNGILRRESKDLTVSGHARTGMKGWKLYEAGWNN